MIGLGLGLGLVAQGEGAELASHSITTEPFPTADLQMVRACRKGGPLRRSQAELCSQARHYCSSPKRNRRNTVGLPWSPRDAPGKLALVALLQPLSLVPHRPRPVNQDRPVKWLDIGFLTRCLCASPGWSRISLRPAFPHYPSLILPHPPRERPRAPSRLEDRLN